MVQARWFDASAPAGGATMESYMRTASHGMLSFTPDHNMVVGPIPTGCSGYSSVLKTPWVTGSFSQDELFGVIEVADLYAANVSWGSWVRGFRGPGTEVPGSGSGGRGFGVRVRRV